MLELSRLVEPVSADSQCGPDLGYDAAFLELECLAAGVSELRMGWSMRAAVPPDWLAVTARATALLARSKDWRTALLIARAALHLEGLKGLESGIGLLLALEKRFGAAVHPRGDDDYPDGWWTDNERDVRNAERMPGTGHPLLADLRGRHIGGAGAAVTLGELEAVQRHGHVGGGRLIGAGDVRRALQMEMRHCHGLAPSLDATLATLQHLSQALERRLSSHHPHSALTQLQQCLAGLARALQWATEAGETEDGELLPMPVPAFKAPTVATSTAPRPGIATRPLTVPRSTSPALDIALLAEPIDADAPCGPNLEYDDDFMALARLQSGVPERFDGAVQAQAPDWPALLQRAVRLLGRTKDLRIAVILTRAATMGDGLRGTASGLALIARLLAPDYWPDVHPVLDAEDNDDPTMRLNALAALSDHEGLLSDLRALEIGSVKGVVLAGTIERVVVEVRSAASDPGAQEERVVVEAVAAHLERQPMFAQWLQDARAMLSEIASTIGDRTAWFADDGLEPLGSFLERLEHVVHAAERGAAPAHLPLAMEDHATDAAPPVPPAAPAAAELPPSPLPTLAEADVERAGVLLGRMRTWLDSATTADALP